MLKLVGELDFETCHGFGVKRSKVKVRGSIGAFLIYMGITPLLTKIEIQNFNTKYS